MQKPLRSIDAFRTTLRLETPGLDWLSFRTRSETRSFFLRSPGELPQNMFPALKVKMSVAQSCLTLQPLGRGSVRLLCPWESPGRNLEWVVIPSPGELPNPEIKPRSPALQILHHLNHQGSPVPSLARGLTWFGPQVSRRKLGEGEGRDRCRSRSGSEPASPRGWGSLTAAGENSEKKYTVLRTCLVSGYTRRA